MDLKGKVALVTGGASGIGRAFAEELVKYGAKVSICDVNDDGEELADQLCQKYGRDRAIFCSCDVTDYPQIEESFQTTVSAYGGIDIVINNAGIFNDRFWELEVDVNLNGVIRGTLLALRYMSKHRGGRGGTIINVAAVEGYSVFPAAPIYCATKHAVVGFTRSYGSPFHTNMTGVRFIALCPGGTKTGMIPENDWKKTLQAPEYEAALPKTINQQQLVQNVGRALIYVLQKAPTGSVWSVENNQLPTEIKLPFN
ncbi:unnamed protein product [Bemisia tabaci]|uniref:15-hydroxyprostaglandin dehydrogenase [NAD(+)] n=1 Tax=Bemisia tabaci TaxID=7038 RepID=A0A9P0EW19_BEMTA|nr:PREDICTED: 15-hydroxyprostaglandin dehydrogenase [NAD(+)]-like [Bemisia tabaci]CAH0381508.1 unnamed protein product [Bemisia tabaci]